MCEPNVSSEWDVFPEEDDDFNDLDDNKDVDIHKDKEQSMTDGNDDHHNGINSSNNNYEIRTKLITEAASEGALLLTQHFCKTFHQPLSSCRVAIVVPPDQQGEEAVDNPQKDDDDDNNDQILLVAAFWNHALHQRGIQPMHSLIRWGCHRRNYNNHEKQPAKQESNDPSDKRSRHDLYDVLLIPSTMMKKTTMEQSLFNCHLVPGGLVFFMSTTPNLNLVFEPNLWSAPTIVFSKKKSVATTTTTPTALHDNCIHLTAVTKLLCPINTESCRHWLPTKHSLSTEQAQLQQATVALSAAQTMQLQQKQPPQTEQEKSSTSSLLPLSLSHAQHQKAISALANHGYCIVRQLLNSIQCQVYGSAVLQDLHLANTMLQRKFQVDVYQPHTNPDSYRELSMREDLRMDLRDGPQLRILLGSSGSSNSSNNSSTLRQSHLFWQQPDLVYIVQQVMYPRRDEFRCGNFGRYNFDGIDDDESRIGQKGLSGAAPSYSDESCPPLKVSSVGGIISLPGSADQAIHADTPHLFEHENCLPAHYINAFTPGCVHADPRVGGTAFVHGSHQLAFTTKYCPTSNNVGGTNAATDTASLKEEMYCKYLVRPWLQPGDVLLFDCRILHFGLANLGTEARPILYTNITHAWFHDPKNWDDRQSIFDDEPNTLCSKEQQKIDATSN